MLLGATRPDWSHASFLVSQAVVMLLLALSVVNLVRFFLFFWHQKVSGAVPDAPGGPKIRTWGIPKAPFGAPGAQSGPRAAPGCVGHTARGSLRRLKVVVLLRKTRNSEENDTPEPCLQMPTNAPGPLIQI